MKRILFLGLVIASCVKAPQTGTPEWTAEQYSNALMQTDYDSMRKYATPDSTPPVAPESLQERLKGLHPIKQCAQSSNAEKTSFITLILIAGSMNNSVYGVEVTTVKKDSGWQVERASYAVDGQGVPKRYLRNCEEDTTVEKKPIQGI